MIAINMKMPKNCIECRFGQSECGFCHAMTANFVGYIYQSEDEGRPDWCPLRQVDKLMVEHVFQKDEFERYGKDVIRNYLTFEVAKKFGDKIVGDMMCKWESKPIDSEIMPNGTCVRTTVCVVRPNAGGECVI